MLRYKQGESNVNNKKRVTTVTARPVNFYHKEDHTFLLPSFTVYAYLNRKIH